jgi:hypothetical protein
MDKRRLISERDCKYATICPCACNGTCDGPKYMITYGREFVNYDICIPRIIGQTCCCVDANAGGD